MKMNEHPTVVKMSAVKAAEPPQLPLEADWLKKIAMACGADDAGFVSLDSEYLDDQRDGILRSFPHGRSVISIVCKMNEYSIRAPQRSVANHEFHHTGKHVDAVCRDLTRHLNDQGIRALNEPMAFPMEYADFPEGKTWIIAHKTVAVAAGMGQMGIHRNVIHPKFGNFILLGSVVIDREIRAPKHNPIDFNPCLECKLCVAACPVGAIASDGYFNFSACMTHNYREFMGGFIDWVKVVTESKSMDDYKEKFDDGETVSLWQSLSYGANYKAAYCMAVCPAGENVIAPFLNNKSEFINTLVRPLQDKSETIYVAKGTDAVEHVKKHFPNKRIKYVGRGLNPRSIKGFLFGSKLIFQPGKAKGLNTRIHFQFTGAGGQNATYVI